MQGKTPLWRALSFKLILLPQACSRLSWPSGPPGDVWYPLLQVTSKRAGHWSYFHALYSGEIPGLSLSLPARSIPANSLLLLATGWILLKIYQDKNIQLVLTSGSSQLLKRGTSFFEITLRTSTRLNRRQASARFVHLYVTIDFESSRFVLQNRNEFLWDLSLGCSMSWQLRHGLLHSVQASSARRRDKRRYLREKNSSLSAARLQSWWRISQRGATSSWTFNLRFYRLYRIFWREHWKWP